MADEDPPEMRDPNMEPLPDHKIPDYDQENGKEYMRAARAKFGVRND
jgi:hypothetical protein